MTISKFETNERFKGQSAFSLDESLAPEIQATALWTEYATECRGGNIATPIYQGAQNIYEAFRGKSIDSLGMNGITFAYTQDRVNPTLIDITLDELTIEQQVIADYLKITLPNANLGVDALTVEVVNPDLSQTTLGIALTDLTTHTQFGPMPGHLVFNDLGIAYDKITGIQYVKEIDGCIAAIKRTRVESTNLPVHTNGIVAVQKYLTGLNAGLYTGSFSATKDANYVIMDAFSNTHSITMRYAFCIDIHEKKPASQKWRAYARDVLPNYIEFSQI